MNTSSIQRRISIRAGALMTVLFSLILAEASFAEEGDVGRKGVFMGMDPGFSGRIDGDGKSLFARLDLRIGGCLNRWFHLGVDWRSDLLVTSEEDTFDKRHEIGPVATFFMVRGWFSRIFAHLGGIDPFMVTGGLQTGYEFSAGRFSGIGLAVGGDADIPFDGGAPTGYSVSLVLYLTAYDLGNRRGRDF